MNNRIVHIDIAKGISILLVAMFHSNLKVFVPEIIEPMSLFRMPLFFFLSGVFFSYSISPSEFMIKKSEALLKPYFAVLILLWFISVFSQSEHIAWELKGIFYGNGDTLIWTPMWFLTHLFAVYCFVYVLFRFVKFNTLPGYVKSILLFISLLVGALTIDVFWYREIIIFGREFKLPGLPFSIDIIFITSVFFISGHLLRDKIVNFYPNVVYVTLSVFMFLYILFFSDAHTDLNKRIYVDPIAATLGAICGIYMVMFVSWLLGKYKISRIVFASLGSASLYILIFHSFIGSRSYNYISAGVVGNDALIVLAAVAVILSVSLPLVIKKIALRNDYVALFFLPFKSNKLLQRTLNIPR